MPGSGAHADALMRAVLAAAPRGCDAVADPLDDLLRTLRGPLSIADSERLLQALRSHRCFDAMRRLCDALLALGATHPYVRRQYAQALIEGGQHTLASRILEDLLRELPASETSERSEALGLLGRAHKQRFVNCSEDRAGAARELERSIRRYEEAYPLDPAWHGANLVALARRADRDGITVAGGPRFKDVAQRLIKDLNAVPRKSWTPWTHAAAGEAYLALGEWKAAQEHYGRFATHDDVDAFALAGAARQLREIWGFEPEGSEPPAAILAALQTKAIASRGGEVAPTPKELAQLAGTLREEASHETPGEAFEAILGENRQVPIGVVLALTRVARSVCQVVDRHLHAQQRKSGGTGFLVDGRALRADWEGRGLVVTNHHVLSEDGTPPSVRHVNADVIFHFWKGQPQTAVFSVESLLEFSPRHELDFAIAALRGPAPPSVEDSLPGFLTDPLALAPREAEPPDRVYVVGHPDGRGLEFSLSDNEVVDHQLADGSADGRRLIHYRAPTEKGMSGSPVLDPRRFEAIGLHRAGGKVAPLRPRRDTDVEYRANEAVWGKSILDVL